MNSDTEEQRNVAPAFVPARGLRWLAVGYFSVVAYVIAFYFVHEYGLIRLDARVYRLMTSNPQPAYEQVKVSLSDVIISERLSNDDQRSGHVDAYLVLKKDWTRELYLRYEESTGRISHWSMITGGSDVVDTEAAVDASATLQLLMRALGAGVIVLLPIPLLVLQRRVQTKTARVMLIVALVVFGLISIAVSLLLIAMIFLP